MAVIIVHGGAGSTQLIPDDRLEEFTAGIKAAVKEGYSKLTEGKPAVDAVQAAIKSLENNGIFDAGYGSVLTDDGTVEMDATIMCGKTLNAGGVACIKNIKNPIEVARKVLDEGRHVLYVGEGANKFAEKQGIQRVPPEELITKETKEEFDQAKSKGYENSVSQGFGPGNTPKQQPSGHDTVGAVAMDKDGNLAYGTSTGGIMFKKPGRVGDSPIVGAGGYADNDVGAISCTGHGESFIKVCLAYQVMTQMKAGLKPDEAAEVALKQMEERVKGHGGVIVLSNKGVVGKHFTTARMAWAWARDGKLHYGIKKDEDHEERI